MSDTIGPERAAREAERSPVTAPEPAVAHTAHPQGRLRRFFDLLAIDASPLKRRDFRLLFTGQIVTFFGSMMTYVGVPYQVFSLTHSSLAVGMVGLAELLPLMLTAWIGGALADVRDRRTMVQLTDIGLIAGSSGLLINSLLPSPSLWPLYVCAGAMAGLESGWTIRVRRHGAAVLWSAAVWGLAVAALGYAPSLPVALACLALAGAADMVSGLFRMTIWNQTIPDALRGRLASIELVSYSSGPLLGNVESGAVAALVGPRASVISGGLLCVVGVFLCALVLPGLRRYEAPVIALQEKARG